MTKRSRRPGRSTRSQSSKSNNPTPKIIAPVPSAQQQPTQPQQQQVVLNPTPNGLINRGNTCYLNSAMQCLARTSPIADLLLKGTANLCPNGTFASHNNNVTKAATRVVHSILYASSSDANQSITALKTALGNENADFATGDQQDVQELFSFLIDKLHEDQNHSTANPDDDEGIYAGSSPVNDAVSCKRVLETTCTCGATSVQQDPMSIIQIALPSETRTSLEECVASHFMDVVLSGDNSFECSICKKKTEATQRLSLAELPPIIPIHLVRFSADGRSKNNTHVDIPEELDLSEYRVQGNDDTETPAVYRRYAVIKHIGGVGGGHYVAYVKGRDGIWRLFDDDKPPQVLRCRGRGLDRTLSDGAYMVFYAREDVDLNALDASEVVPLADLPEVVFPPLPNDPRSLVQEDDDEEEEDDNINPNPELNADRASEIKDAISIALKVMNDVDKPSKDENPFTSTEDVLKAMSLKDPIREVADDILDEEEVNEQRPVQEFIQEWVQKAATVPSNEEWTEFVVDWKKRVGKWMADKLKSHHAKPNLGPDPSTSHAGMEAGHYTPQDDADDAPEIVDPLEEDADDAPTIDDPLQVILGYYGVPYNLAKLDNPCLLEAMSHIPTTLRRAVLRKYFGFTDDDDIDAITLDVAFVDAVLFSLETPDSKWSKEKREKFIQDQKDECYKLLGASEDEMRLLSACNYSNHAVSKVLHTGEPLVVQPFSPEIEQIFDITGTTVLYMFRPRLPHPQKSMMKFALRGYKDETLDYLDHVVLVTCILLGVFSKAELEKLSKVQSAHIDVYWKKAWSGLTPKEIAEEKELMKEQRRANYRKMVNNFCDKDLAACLTHAQKKDSTKTLDSLTYDDKKSYMMSVRFKKSVNSFCNKDLAACLTHAQKKNPKKTLSDLTWNDKISYMNSCNFETAKANGRGYGAWRAASEEERKEKGWKDNQTLGHNIACANRKGEINKKSSGNYEVKVGGLNIGTYETRKIAELAKNTAVEVFNSAPMSEDKALVLKRARVAAEKATNCPSAKPRKRKSGEDFLVDDDEEKKWCRGSGTPRNKTWIRNNIVGGKATFAEIFEDLEQGRIQSRTDRVTKHGRKRVKIEYMRA